MNLEEVNKQEKNTSASKLLEEALFCLIDRASERDAEAERSMKACVNAFNTMYGTNLTEVQGWLFMVFLKLSRAKQGKLRLDDYIDASAYCSLAGEAAAKENNGH